MGGMYESGRRFYWMYVGDYLYCLVDGGGGIVGLVRGGDIFFVCSNCSVAN